MALLDAHAIGYSIALIPFGFATILIGHLLRESQYVPRVIAALIGIAGFVYVFGSFAHIIDQGFYDFIQVLYGVPIVAETGLALWLAFKGVRSSRAPQPAVAPAA